MKPLAALFCASLTGCASIPPSVPTTWTYDSVRREAFLDRRDLVTYCVDHRGWFTRDNAACMIQARHLCVYVTPPYDNGHNVELTALCNGWRPFPRLT